jgi:hypothetical protein
MDWFADFPGETGPYIWISLANSGLTVAGIVLFAYRFRWAWLFPVATTMTFLSLSIQAQGLRTSFGPVLTLAVCGYGLWRWQLYKDGATAAIPLRRACAVEWGIAAGLLILFTLISGFAGLELLSFVGPEYVLSSLLSSLPLVMYLGFAHGIFESWFVGAAFGALNLASLAVLVPAPPAAFIYTAVILGLYVFGLLKWKAALNHQGRPAPVAHPAGS